MENALRDFYGRCTNSAALALSIAAFLFLTAAIVSWGIVFSSPAQAADQPSRAATAKSPPVNDGLPEPGFVITYGTTAIVITDPQNDFLSPKGVTWGVVGKSVTENGTVKNIEALFKAADETGMPVFVSPHYYYEQDHKWKFEGTLETLMHNIGMFDRPNALALEGFENSGADWLNRYKSYINNGNTVVTSPHKAFLAPKATISLFNYARPALIKLFWRACRQTCVRNLTCAP